MNKTCTSIDSQNINNLLKNKQVGPKLQSNANFETFNENPNICIFKDNKR